MRRFLSCACLFFLLSTPVLAGSQLTGEVPLPSPTFTYRAHLSTPPAQRFDGPDIQSACLDGPAVECHSVDDILNTYGYGALPPDPTCAVGPTHVINATNMVIQWRPRNNPQDAPEFEAPLALFFGLVDVPTDFAYTTDPKVIYDQYAGRFVLVVMDGNDLNLAKWLMAVSKTSDPNDGWWFHSFDRFTIVGGIFYYGDYPGLSVDDDAVYITANMFSNAPAYYGPYLWIVRKTPGGYDGPDGLVFATTRDLKALGLTATTTQPAHMFGPAPNGILGAPFGTFLVSYGGQSAGGIESIRVIAVNDPLGTAGGPFLFLNTLTCGDIDNTVVPIPNAPQLGGPELIHTIDRRVYNAVWRDNSLYFAADCMPPSGPDAGQVTAHWWQVNTAFDGVFSPTVVLADQGNIGAEDLGAGTYTWIPSVMVNAVGDMAVGFAASGPSIYAGAYFAARYADDPAGTIGSTCTLAAGLDYYYRIIPPDTRNRWGDYTGLALSPTDQLTFWIYHEYAGIGGLVDVPPTLGQGLWHTKLGKFYVTEPPTSVAVTAFDATASAGVVMLRAAFLSDLDVEAVNVYRGGEASPLIQIESVSTGGGSRFEYTDPSVTPGETYRYRIGVVDRDGEFYSPIVTVSVNPFRTTLSQNHPNPFNPTTEITFTVATAGPVSIDVYDIAGHLIRHLLAGEQTAGEHVARWDGRDEHGNPAASGVYFYRLDAGKYTATRRMVLLK